MSLQQINLLNPQLLTPRVAFSTKTIALALLAVTAIGLVLYALVQYSSNGIRQQLDQAQTKHDELQARLDSLSRPAKNEQADKDKQAQAVAQEEKRIARLKILQETLGAGQGKIDFSARLRAFAQASVQGVWLTGFEIGVQTFHLEGRALQTDRITDYLALLARQTALKDLPLTGFSIAKDETKGENPPVGVMFSVNPDTTTSAAGTK